MERGETHKRLQENGSTAMNAERTTDLRDETDEEGPEIDKGQTIKIRLRGAKVKAKRTGNNDGLADKETERVGTDIESVAWGGETVPSFTQSTPLSETDDVNLFPSQMGEMQQIPTTDAPSMVSEDVKDVKEETEETEEYTAAVLRDPVRVRRHDYMARDIAAFLLNYPSRVDDPESTANVRFYNNEIRFRPYGLLIDAFHTRAFGHFKILEQHHGYIQWLFPIREQGLNHLAYPLQIHEAATIRHSPEMQARVITSMTLMLDFYGMAISPTNSLLITRHSDRRICQKRYRNLLESYHNYLRITRIFKSLVELGLQDYVPSVMLFMLAEQSENGKLDGADLKASMDRYWVYCMRERDAQSCVATAIIWVRGDGEFTMEAYEKIIQRKQSHGVWEFDAEALGLRRGSARSNTWITARVVGRLRSFSS